MTSPTVRRRRLSAELRRRRVQAGMTLSDVAEELEWSPAKLGHIETGIRKWPSVMEISALLRLYGVTGGQREAILTLVRESRLRPWWTEYEDVLSSAYVGNEAGAVYVQSYSGILVPDLLQVPDYTATVARALGHGEHAVERMVAAYLKRQEILDQGGLARYHAVVEEDALQRVSGDLELLRAQTTRIVELATESDRVTVQLLPTSAGPHPGVAGPFSVLEFDEDEAALAYVEATQGGSIVEAEESVEACKRVWSGLTRIAASPQATVAILRRMALLT
ncbi:MULTISPECIES: helix-turn-helix domain-containing protein [Nocardiopsis]|uniref:Transcriptional regulator with XRE-family HTH domain n=2 Tax=Nocardiopsis sinuspersici TaxID=501010 RepID=A0A7Z0BKN5_9ACTN|nr:MULTISPECIES: helix-turn-helix transcriptional regulator [Nocardiopsis]NYH52652.1 transcriptional regulator with XRE-family HTH domain [Nocardiopsis sinuspersici]